MDEHTQEVTDGQQDGDQEGLSSGQLGDSEAPPVGSDPDAGDEASGSDPDTFDRDYVIQLRNESAGHRRTAREAEQRASDLAKSLWLERVASLNLLADPADLPFDADALDDRDRIETMARELLELKPHLRTRRITGTAGQGEGTESADVSLVSMLQQRA